jgi:hypothetical protein
VNTNAWVKPIIKMPMTVGKKRGKTDVGKLGILQ